MSIWQRFLRWWTGSRQNPIRTYALDDQFHKRILDLAAQVNRPPDEVNSDVLALGLDHYNKADRSRRRWEALSARERDVTALACLGYSNRQIAARLGLTEGTVRSYMQNVLVKLNLHSKADLRVAFASWDFSAWGPPHA